MDSFDGPAAVARAFRRAIFRHGGGASVARSPTQDGCYQLRRTALPSSCAVRRSCHILLATSTYPASNPPDSHPLRPSGTRALRRVHARRSYDQAGAPSGGVILRERPGSLRPDATWSRQEDHTSAPPHVSDIHPPSRIASPVAAWTRALRRVRLSSMRRPNRNGSSVTTQSSPSAGSRARPGPFTTEGDDLVFASLTYP